MLPRDSKNDFLFFHTQLQINFCVVCVSTLLHFHPLCKYSNYVHFLFKFVFCQTSSLCPLRSSRKIAMVKNPFKNSVSGLSIQYDPPICVFRPGDVVKGNVLITIDEEIKARRVVLYFYGKAFTQWTESQDRGGYYDCNGYYQSIYETVYYSSQQIYINLESLLWQGERLPAGQYRYPFAFQLPTQLPPCFEGVFCFKIFKVLVIYVFQVNGVRFDIIAKRKLIDL